MSSAATKPKPNQTEPREIARRRAANQISSLAAFPSACARRHGYLLGAEFIRIDSDSYVPALDRIPDSKIWDFPGPCVEPSATVGRTGMSKKASLRPSPSPGMEGNAHGVRERNFRLHQTCRHAVCPLILSSFFISWNKKL
jgi:hypothetical protein